MGFHSKPNTFVSHVRIKVENLERSLHYYREIIGFQVLEQTETTAVLTTDGQTSILSLEQPDRAIPKQGRTAGLYHFAILLPNRSDLANFVFHLIDKGIRIGSSDHLVSEALYLSDPDGNGIEVYIDRDPSVWSWRNGEVAMTVDPLNFEELLADGNQQQPWNGLPASTVMGHIHLHVSELKETEEFYTKGLGFDVVNRFGAQALFISTGGYHHHIGLNTWNGTGAPLPPENSPGLKFFTLTLPSEEDRHRVITNLRAIGASVEEENGIVVTHDPTGNRIYLQV
ncbi:VOC family protein [Bacillus thermotolerans]|uniref:VOC family protein n=1 Tax=Bacillus thermotolerans TaxID=1221996 RepID=UPI0005895A6E|nr:VOC family protein [Bacillus thermotolerans]KKB33651.1 Glyoxalase family protein [Bacillus thermotolerans]